MVILSITGIIHLFKPQIESARYRDLMVVSPSGPALSYSQQLESAAAAYPDGSLARFRPSDAANRAAEVGIKTADGRNLTVFVDPYTGAVKGDRNDDTTLAAQAELIHGTLLIGNAGDRIIELAACWALVLVITGLYLWFPHKRSAIWGTLLPRLRARGRTRWRDLHAVTGFYGSLLILFMILTGLPWTGFWGDQFTQIWSNYPETEFTNVPKSAVLTGSLNEGGEKIIPWAAEQMPMPASDPSANAAHQGHGGETTNSATTTAETLSPTPIGIESVIGIAEARGVPSGYTVALPQDETGVYTVATPSGTPTTRLTMHIDQYSGEVLADVGWAQYGSVARAVQGGIDLHQGTWFGLPNQLVMLSTALAILVLAVTAPVMWWKRRPAGRLGAPAMPKNFPVWKGAVAIIVVLGLIFPFVGISLLAVLLLDFLVIRRIPVLQRTFA